MTNFDAPPEAIEGALERIAKHARRIVYLRAAQDAASILSATQPVADDCRTHGTVD